MSLRYSCSIVPEIIYDAPKEIKAQALQTRINKAIAIAFLQTYRIGMIVTVRGARGCVLKKLPDDSWSAPCGLMFGGPSIGANVGVEIADMIVFINTEEALKGFMDKSAGVSLCGGLSIGPIGRTGEAMLNSASPQGIVMYAQSKGLYGGVSLDFSGIVADKTANKVEYGEGVTVAQILDGTAARPKGEVFDRMYKALADVSGGASASASTAANTPQN